MRLKLLFKFLRKIQDKNNLYYEDYKITNIIENIKLLINVTSYVGSTIGYLKNYIQEYTNNYFLSNKIIKNIFKIKIEYLCIDNFLINKSDYIIDGLLKDDDKLICNFYIINSKVNIVNDCNCFIGKLK